MTDRIDIILTKVYETGQTPQSTEFVVRRETINLAKREILQLFEAAQVFPKITIGYKIPLRFLRNRIIV